MQERELLIKQRDQLLAAHAALLAHQQGCVQRMHAEVGFSRPCMAAAAAPPQQPPTGPAFRLPPGLSLPNQAQTPGTCQKERKTVSWDDGSDVASTCSGSADSTEVASYSGSIVSTVMMRNIPNRYSHTALAAVLDNQGFSGAYDLIYLPFDFASGVSFGYAFVNLTSITEADRFAARFDGFKWGVSSKKVCRVVPCQNNESPSERVERYRNLPVMHPSVPDAFKPVLFSSGQRVPFPEPTKPIRASRIHTRGRKE